MNLNKAILLGTLLLVSGICTSQIFEDYSNMSGIDFTIYNSIEGNSVSFYDFNQDGWDDITFANSWADPAFYKNNGNGSFELIPPYISNSKVMRCLLWVDFDNDGDPDLFATYDEEPYQLWENNGQYSFTDISEEAGLAQTDVSNYGANWADYDRDGFLDLYVSSYYNPGDPNDLAHLNHLYRNLGDGTFEDVSLNTDTDNGYASTLCNVFWDYDNDLWPDLYVVNDKTFSNALLHNNGDGTFEDVSAESNSDIVLDGMSATSGDYNNDGFLDMYCTNNPEGNVLLKNNSDGEFTDISAVSQTQIFEMSWGANWIDYDNDGLQDLYVCTQAEFYLGEWIENANFLFKNNGTDTFSPVMAETNLTNDDAFSYCTAIGDFDNNGFPDIVQSNVAPWSSRLFKNSGGDGNWLSIDLNGIVSNKEAIGCWIHAYAEDNIYKRYTYLGENYMSQNSQREIIGFGEAEVCDSLEILWISGIRDVFFDVELNQILEINEGQSLSASIIHDYSTYCPGDSLALTVNLNGTTTWSDGSVQDTLWVSQEGDYSASTTLPEGIVVEAEAVWISEAPPLVYNLYATNPTCLGGNDGSLILEFPLDSSVYVYWDNDVVGSVLLNLGAGEYVCTAFGDANCPNTISGSLIEGDSIEWQVSLQQPTCHGNSDGIIEFISSVDSLEYYIGQDTVSSFHLPAGVHSFELSNSAGCAQNILITLSQPDSLNVAVSLTEATEESPTTATAIVSGGTAPYAYQWNNGDTSITTTLPPGDGFTLWVSDFHNCLAQTQFDVPLSIVEVNEQRFTIYPNPCQTEFHIRSEIPISEDVFVRIYDARGVLVYSKLSRSSTTINTSGFVSGIYTVSITANSWTHSESIVCMGP